MNYYELLIRRSRNQPPQDNEIWYYAPEKVTLYSETDVTSHTFYGGKGVIRYSSAVTTVPQTLRGVTTITDVQFPSIVTMIDNEAFKGCTSLALKKLPDGLTGIGNSAFSNCTNLALSELPASLKTMGTNVFSDCSSLALTSLPEGLTTINQGAFDGCSNLALTSLPEGVTYMGGFAFRDCKKIALTYLPEGLTSISFSAFFNCHRLALTSLPEGVTSIATNTFNGCTSLALTVLPEGLMTIESNAFSNCSGLTSITFLGTPTTLNAAAFSNCTNLKDIYVPWAEGDIADAPWGAVNATVHYSGSGSGGTITFPDSFSVTSCSYNGAAVGTYEKTANTTTVGGKDYPVYSMTQVQLGITFYIFACDKFNGASGAYWALNGDSEYSSTMDGNNTLGAVSVGSDGLPSSTMWSSAKGTASVSWSVPTPVIPTDYVRRYLLADNLKDSKHLDNSDYNLVKPSGTTVSYATIFGHECAKISNGCVYNQNRTGMGITNGGALSIWTCVPSAPSTTGNFCCFANASTSFTSPFAVGYRNGHYAFAYTPSVGNANEAESSVNVAVSEWKLLTINYDATNKKVQLWINDKLEIDVDMTDKLKKDSGIVVNGQNATNGTPDGMPDVSLRYRSLTFFNRTLSPQEIKGLYVEYNQ